MGCYFPLEGIFQDQGLNSRLLHWQAASLPLSHLRSACISRPPSSAVLPTHQPMPALLSLLSLPLPQHLVSSANNSRFPGALSPPPVLLPSWFSSPNRAQYSGLLDPRRVTLTVPQLSQYQGLGTPPGPLNAPKLPELAQLRLWRHCLFIRSFLSTSCVPGAGETVGIKTS